MVTDTERGSHYISQNVPFLFDLLKDGIKNFTAHDAMGDTYASLELAKLINAPFMSSRSL